MREVSVRARTKFSIIWLSAIILAAIPWVAPVTRAAEKLKPEEVVAKHLESIGTAQARAAVTNRLISGDCTFNTRLGGAFQGNGPAVLASEDTKNLIGMNFGLLQYPFEKFTFDGKNLSVAPITPGVRSAFGSLLYSHSTIFREGLFGGTLSTAWPLLNLDLRRPKLEYSGTKKVDDKECHVLKYLPKERTDFTVKLFFDKDSFRHVRTEYELVITAQMGPSPEQSSQQQETRHKITEGFSDFKTENGLTLPHAYRIEYTINSQNGNRQYDWVITLKKFEFNQRLAPGSFSVDQK